jgi:hypothetical protein
MKARRIGRGQGLAEALGLGLGDLVLARVGDHGPLVRFPNLVIAGLVPAIPRATNLGIRVCRSMDRRNKSGDDK